jgi:alpha-1,2-mannosyltransferase
MKVTQFLDSGSVKLTSFPHSTRSFNIVMAETCKAPDGSDMMTFGLDSKRAILLISIIGITPMLVILGGPQLVGYIGRTVGFYLRQKTAGRKQQVLEIVAKDEKEFRETGEKRRDSDEWESVESYATGTAKNGEKADKEWDGIVGFFHPFWYGKPLNGTGRR